MKSRVINKQFPALLLIFILTGIITTGCGSDNSKCDTFAPSNASIEVSGPASVAVAFDTAFDFTAVVLYNDGKPMPKACLTISSAFAFPRNAAGTGWRYTFYALPRGTENPDNYAVDNGFSAKTDDYGQYTFSAQYTAGSGSFKDTVTVRSGVVMGTADFEIQ